jgi:hypothetical protein
MKIINKHNLFNNKNKFRANKWIYNMKKITKMHLLLMLIIMKMN